MTPLNYVNSQDSLNIKKDSILENPHRKSIGVKITMLFNEIVLAMSSTVAVLGLTLGVGSVVVLSFVVADISLGPLTAAMIFLAAKVTLIGAFFIASGFILIGSGAFLLMQKTKKKVIHQESGIKAQGEWDRSLLSCQKERDWLKSEQRLINENLIQAEKVSKEVSRGLKEIQENVIAFRKENPESENLKKLHGKINEVAVDQVSQFNELLKMKAFLQPT